MTKTLLIFVCMTMLCDLFSQDSLSILGNEALVSQDYAKAFRYYNQSYQADTNNVAAGFRTANVSFILGNTQVSKELCLKLFSQSKDTSLFLPLLAKIYDSENNASLSIKAYRKLCSLYPENSTYFKKLASIYSNNDLNNDALQMYKIAHNLNPNDITTIINLADAYLNAEMESLALATILKGVKIDSTNNGVVKLSARIHYALKDYHAVVQELLALLEKADLSSFYHNILGISLMNIDSFDQAKFHLIKSFAHPEYKEYGYYYLATMEEKKDNYTQAMMYYDEAIRESISPFLDSYLRRKGELFVQLEKYDESLVYFNKAYEYKDRPEYLYLIGQVYDLQEQTAKAIDNYTKYIEITGGEGKYESLARVRIEYLRTRLGDGEK